MLNAAMQPDTSDTSRQDEFRLIVDLSREMRDRARSGEWEAVAKIQDYRKSLICNFFEKVPHAEEAEFLRPGIQRILDLDKEVMTLGDAAKETLTGKLAGLSSNRKATHAYLDNQ